MSFSNANYLSNPNRLSTKVHYAPGGASSLSLAWDDTPNPRSVPPKYPQNNYQKQQTEPGQNYGYNQQQWDQKGNRNQYEPVNQPYSPPQSQDPNRVLEAELQYYQNRNKIIGSNIIGGNEGSEHSRKHSREQYTPPSQYGSHQQQPQQPLQPYYGYDNRPQQGVNVYPQNGGYGKHSEELDIALYEHRKRQDSAPYGQYVGQNTEKTSVRVNNPPGGRSNIIFG